MTIRLLEQRGRGRGLAAVAIWLGILSVRGGLRFRSFVRLELARTVADYTPFVTVIGSSNSDFTYNDTKVKGSANTSLIQIGIGVAWH